MTDDQDNDRPSPDERGDSAEHAAEDAADEGEGGKGAGRKHNVQLDPEEQRGRPDPKERKDFPRQNIPNS
ncbi:MAG: hypothetical protein ACR2GQ_05655 [Gemmatimonadota bacterium]